MCMLKMLRCVRVCVCGGHERCVDDKWKRIPDKGVGLLINEHGGVVGF